MGVSPWPVGQLTPMTIPLTQESKIVDLTNENIGHLSVLIYSVTTNGPTTIYTLLRTSTGPISIVQNKPAIIQWSPSSLDVASAGNFAFRVEVNWGGITPQLFDYIPWVIQA